MELLNNLPKHYNYSGGPPKLMKGINTFTPHGL